MAGPINHNRMKPHTHSGETTILIVDDFNVNLELLVAILSGEGYRTITAMDGQKALELAESEKVDLILLDILMPGMDGFEVCKILKKNVTTKDIPVIFISALDGKEDYLKGFEAGAYDFFTKPLRRDEILAKVQNCIHHKYLDEQLKREQKYRERIQNAIIESEKKFRFLYDSAPDAYFLVNRDGLITDSNKAARIITGYEENELYLRHFDKSGLMPDYRVVKRLNGHGRRNRDMVVIHQETLLKRSDGQLIDVEVHHHFIAIENEDHILIVVRDIRERKQIQRKLMRAIMETEERERRRFSQDLHDGLGPLLSSAKLYLKSLDMIKDSSKRALALLKIMEILDESISSLKEIANNISPHLLKNFGLEPAINHFIKRINDTNSVTVEPDLDIPCRFCESTEVSVFRIVVELITNSIRHAEAGKISIRLVENGNNLALDYRDDGKGFDADQAMADPSKNGITNIINRVNTLNGSIVFNSRVRQGFGVKIEIFNLKRQEEPVPN